MRLILTCFGKTQSSFSGATSAIAESKSFNDFRLQHLISLSEAKRANLSLLVIIALLMAF